MKKEINRKEFLSMIGLGAGAILIPSCIGGCSKDSTSSAPSNVNIIIDLTKSENSDLLNVGGYIYNSGVLIANTTNGYYAVQQLCTHQGAKLTYNKTVNKINCSNHTEQYFSVKGISEHQQPADNLKTYTVTKNGTILTITG